MDADVGVDDKLLPGEPHTVIGDLAIDKGPLRDTHIHHDLGSGLGDGVQVQGFNIEFQQTLIHGTGLPLDTGDGDGHVCGYGGGASLSSNDTGDP
ncbi:hypothetical protein ES703_37371 [subsurface metagenome]